MALSSEEVNKQSVSAFRQWEDIWREHAITNGRKCLKDNRSHKDLLFDCTGKNLLCVANAPSLEKQIDVIKKNYTGEYKIACVDKCYGHLIKHGIKPDYVFVADANVSYEENCKPYINESEDVILISSICANPQWSKNWKGPVYYYVNKDNIQSEKIFIEISGCQEVIPASSNVGNTVIVFATQILNPDEMMLIGYDYGWKDSENYYAFQDSDKRYWMKHAGVVDREGNFSNTSQNLIFSSRWLNDYYQGIAKQKNIKMCMCEKSAISDLPFFSLERKLKMSKKRKLEEHEKNNIMQTFMENIVIHANPEADTQLKQAINNNSVHSVVVNHIPEDRLKWLQAN